MLRFSLVLLFSTLLLLQAAAESTADRPVKLKDLVSIEGVRENQLFGYGLVVGLNGTGDKRQTVFSAQSLANLLLRMGVSVAPTAIQVRNTAAVMVTANLPPFAQPGIRMDVTVSAIGDSSNLQGGVLVMTPLKAADGQVYAAAQGSVITGGFSAGSIGNTKVVNHPTAGRVPNGAIIERTAPSAIHNGHVRLQLRQADFTTAARVADVISKHFADGRAHAESSASIAVDTPQRFQSNPVEFLAELENLTVQADETAKIVINERTGTIVMGKDVRISPVAILHGALTVEIQTTFDVIPPQLGSAAEAATVPQTTVTAKEEKAKNILLKQGASIEELVRALTGIGSTPRDIIAILQSLKAAGAIEAAVEVI